MRATAVALCLFAVAPGTYAQSDASGTRITSEELEPLVIGRRGTIDFLTGANVVGYSEVRSGVNLTTGRGMSPFSRLYLTYGYEVIDTAVSSELLEDLDAQEAVGVPLFNPTLDPGRRAVGYVLAASPSPGPAALGGASARQAVHGPRAAGGMRM